MPVSVSGWKSEAGGGVECAPTVMETSGPFAALAARKAQMEAEAAANPAAAVVAGASAPAQTAEHILESSSEWGIAVNNLDWSYPGIDGQPIEGQEPLIKDMDLKLKPGSCCLLLGANGAGKTTLLKILGGKHMVPRGKVLIHGREAFYDTALTTSGALSYIGGNWQRDVAFAGYGVTLAGDFPVGLMRRVLSGQREDNPAQFHRHRTICVLRTPFLTPGRGDLWLLPLCDGVKQPLPRLENVC